MVHILNQRDPGSALIHNSFALTINIIVHQHIDVDEPRRRLPAVYEQLLHVRVIQLPSCSTFQAVVSSVHRAVFNAVVVAFFEDLSDLLERLSTFTSPLMITGD